MMTRTRRFVALVSQLLLLQWMVLGSGVACRTHGQMPGGSQAHMSGAMTMQAAVSGSNALSSGDQLPGCRDAGSSCPSSPAPQQDCAAMTACVPVAVSATSTSVTTRLAASSSILASSIDTPPSVTLRPEPPPPRA